MPTEREIAVLFSSITKRYDFLNHFLSLNIDKIWRKKLVQLSNPSPDSRILDICTGTGDVVIEFAEKSGSSQCFGIDISEKMLAAAQKKINRSGLDTQVHLTQASALDIPFDEDCFDIVFISFGLRNLLDRAKGIQETIRVLKKGGKIFILELSPTPKGLIGFFYKMYLNFIIPVLGGYISNDPDAYRYLATSIQNFLEPRKVLKLMKEKGYTDLKATPLTGRIAYIYEGTK
ncbi:bifunctional demethylmenaquinone methyltransferase/2-methoxy-6-polyprenyl-1,4-benzoquinol methylase UbiE [Planctomycetota bacterium]